MKNLRITPLNQISNAWGMSFNNIAGMDVLVVVGDDFMYEYIWNNFEGMPQPMRHY